jgi:predicted Zn finger-like uncharacterized protein
MKIVCPSCAATYEVPEAVVAAKRSVRCARCGNNWVPAGDPVAAGPAPGVTPDAVAPAPPPEPVAAPAVAQVLVEPVAQPAPAAPEPVAAEPVATAALQPAAPVAELAPRPGPATAPSYVAPPPAAAAKPVQTAPAAKVAVTTGVKPAKQEPVIGWAASIAVLIILGSVGIVFRGPIMKSWPPSERAYVALGLYHR